MRNFLLLNVPSQWQISPIGHFFSERSEKVSDKDYPPLSVTYDGVVPQLSHVAKTEDRENRKKVMIGDLVINSRSDRRGASGISDHNGSVSLINIVLRPRVGYSRFFHYLIRSKTFQEEFYRRGRGIVDDLWTTRFSDLKSIEVALPNEEEQKLIALYLDRITEKIRSLRYAKNKQIVSIRERENIVTIGQGDIESRQFVNVDAKLPWLSRIPHGWQVKRAKYLFKNVNRPPLEADEIVTVFRDGEVTLRKNRRETGYTFADKEVGYQHIQQGDLVIHTMDAFAGAIGVSDSDGKATGEYAVCVPRGDEVIPDYYAQVLRFMAEVGYVYVLCPSVRERAPRFRFSKLSPVFLPVPPKNEQKSISDFINRSRFIRRKITDSINKLKELEESIIDAAVLGRIDVTRLEHLGRPDYLLDKVEEVMQA
ncbi:MAG: hypothetical protein ABW098_18805 [Candidatus Thiodiazotropha sp.]